MTTQSLINKFICQKIKDYVEPTRKDVPKGHAIGPMRNKYVAANLCLLNLKPKAIASELGISYSLVRDWMADRTFHEEIEKLAAEYAKLFWQTVMEYYRAYNEHYESGGDYDKRPLITDYLGTDLRYGVQTKKAISDTMPKDLPDIDKVCTLDLLVDPDSKNKQDREWSAKMAEIKELVAKQMNKVCHTIMRKPEISKQDRLIVMSYLDSTKPK